MQAHPSPFTRNLRSALVAIAAVALAAAPAIAADDKGAFAVRGVGSDRCDAFLAAVAAKDGLKLERYGSWLLGYVSASNRLIGRTFDAVPSQVPTDVLGIVAVICRNQPAALVDTAASQALVVLNPIRMTADSPLITVSNAGRTLQVRTEALITLQQNLAKKGLYKGPADGKLSPQLAKIIADFQLKEKILISGLPDLDTIIRAGLK